MKKLLCWFVDLLYGPRDDGTRTETKDLLIFLPIIPLVILSILLASCAPSDAQIQEAIAKTQAAQPTATIEPSPTPIALADIDLKSIVFAEGDLPAGLMPAQVSKEFPEWYFTKYKGPEPDNAITYSVAEGTEGAGYVSIGLFSDAEDIAAAYSFLQAGLGKPLDPIEGIGDEAKIADTGISWIRSVLIFTRCSAVTYIFIDASRHEIEIYGKNLDERLTKLVCP